MKLILDVGCGSGNYQKQSKFRGLVNVDILKPTEKIPNFVLCDAQYLPFKDSVFQLSYFMDIIEHLNNPVKCLLELKRVTNKKIILGTPNAVWIAKIIRCFFRGSYSVYPDHITTYGIPELTQLLKRVGFESFYIKTKTYYRANMNRFFYLFFNCFPNYLSGRCLLAIIDLNHGV